MVWRLGMGYAVHKWLIRIKMARGAGGLRTLRPFHGTHSSRATFVLPSYLCIPEGRSHKTVSILKPYVDMTFSDDEVARMTTNLEARGMPDTASRLDELGEAWRRIQILKETLEELERGRREHIARINEFLRSGVEDSAQKERLFEEGRRIKDVMRGHVRAKAELEEVMMPKILRLPNTLHPNTPRDEANLCHVHRNLREVQHAANGSATGHRIRGEAGHHVQFSDVGYGAYYLKGPLADAELAILDYFSDLLTSEGFVPFANPGICKPIVVEGCGYSFDDPQKTFYLKSDTETSGSGDGLLEFVLVGSASLPPFCAYHAKTAVDASSLPLKYFCAGRHYDPSLRKSPASTPSLLQAPQTSRLHYFVGTTKEDVEIAFDRCLLSLERAFRQLDVHFRVVNAVAADLLPAESRRTDIQMWSSSLQRYVTVSNVSSCTDYIAKKLWMCHKNGKNEYGLLNVVHGTGIGVTEFLACLLENKRSADLSTLLPHVLKPYLLLS